MLENVDIESFNSHHNSLAQQHHSHQNALQDLFKQVQSLLSNYTSLKSDYEEVEDGREKYKKQARSQVRSFQAT